MSLFVSFEGGEGSGKSLQADSLRENLQHAGVDVVLVREPGSTSLGDYLRTWLKKEKRQRISYMAEAFLFASARTELVAKTIKPALKRRNTVVIADRYADSTTAYQGYGRRLRLKDVNGINSLATMGIMPDLTFLLDCAPEVGLGRVGAFRVTDLESLQASGASRTDPEGTRRFESESLEFHERVRSGYLKIAAHEPDRWCVIDATKPVEEIDGLVWARVQERLRRAADHADGNASTSPGLWDSQPATRPSRGTRE